MKKTLTLLPLLALITLLGVAASMPKYVGKFYGDGVGLTNITDGSGLTNLQVAATNVISGGQLPTSVIPSPLWTNAATFVIKTNAANGAWVGVVQDTGLVKSNAVTGNYFQVGTNADITSTASSNYFGGQIRQQFNGPLIVNTPALGGPFVGVSVREGNLELAGLQVNTSGQVRVGALANTGFFTSLFANGAETMRLTTDGNIRGLGSLTITNTAAASQPSIVLSTNASIGVYAVSASNPPTSGSGTAFIFAATNAAGTAEIFTMDGAGVVKQISEHAMDAPSALIDDNDEAPNISKEILRYTGKVRWINRSRAARLQEREMKVLLNSLSSYQFLTGKTPTQWTNSNAFGQYTNNLIVLDAMSAADRQVVIVETFAEYNTRNGFTTNSPLYLVKSDWTADQDRFQAEYAASYTNAVNAALANTNAIAPIWNPPAVQPVPAWLYKRGVR